MGETLARHCRQSLEGIVSNQNPKNLFCDNLYAYGPHQNISPYATFLPRTSRKVASTHGRKFRFRRVFFSSLVTITSVLGDTFTRKPNRRLLRKHIGWESPNRDIGSSNVIHDLCFVPDFSNALYMTSISDESYGKF
jgi:hypothetical protein